MALVRKFQEAGKIDSDKKVLVYENVGNYDADKLASVLTLNLDDQAKSLDLSGKDRQAFMQYGAEMILAIKDGNVTKNADGSFSIKGNYGLNNKYSSSEVAEKFANGEVGYGAKKYEGTYQKSHGIFTTDETRDFRHRNHILGLVGQWVNNNLKSLDIIEEKTEEPKELKKFSFNDTFVKANLAGNANLLNDWKALINTQEGRNQALIKAIDNLTPEDYEAWALENPNLGSAADLQKLTSPLREALVDGDIKKAQELAFNLGISINDYIIPDKLTVDAALSDPYLALARQQLTTGENALGNPSEELIAQYAEYLRLEGKTQIEKSLLDKFNKVIDTAWAVELQRLKDELQGNEVFFDSQSTDNAIDPAKEKEVVIAEVGSMQDEMERMQSYIDDLGPDMDPKLQEGFGLTLDILGDTYNALVSGKAEYPEGFKDAWFQEITDGDYKGKVIFKWLLTDKYSIIYDPTNGKFYRIPNLLLPETELFRLLKDAFAALIRNNNENNQEEIPSEKQGGVLKYEIGGGIKDATLLNWGGKKVTQTKPEKVDFAAARESAGLGNEHYEPQNSNEPKKAFTPREFNSPADLLAEDWLRIVSAVSDAVSLGTSSSGVASAGFGLLSTGLDIAADINDDNVTKKEAVKNGITGVAADVFSIIPFAKTARTTSVISKLQGLSRFMPALTAGIAGVYGAEHADEFLRAYDHAINGEFDSNDLYILTQGVRTLVGGLADWRRAHNVKRYANHALVLGTKIMGTDGKWYKIEDADLSELKKIKDIKKANEFFRAKTKATVDLPITTEKKKNSKTNIPDIKTRPYTEVPEGFMEEAPTGQREVHVGNADRTVMNSGRIPSVSLWFANKNNRVFNWINLKRGFNILPLKEMPVDAKKITDASFNYNGAIYRKRDDGLYYMEVPAPKNKKAKVVEETPAAETPEVESKKHGGSLGFARNITIKMRNGGFVPKMEGGGWFEVTDNANKKHYFKDKKAADWFREKNNITADSKEVDSNAYDHGWYLGGLYDEWTKANYAKGKTGIPYNPALKEDAIKLEDDQEYKDFTKWVIDSLKEGKGNAYNAVIDYLHKMAGYKDGLNYFKDDGKTLIDNYDLILLNYYYDHARGYHHHKGTHRGNETLYYLNGELVDLDAVKDLTMDHEYGQESEDKTTTHKFYVTDKQGDTLNEGDQLIPATDETDPNAPLEYKDRLNWGNISEAGRVLWLNARNAKAAEQSMNWDPAQVGYIHRNEMLEGDYESLKNAAEGQASLNSTAGLTFSTDANTQLAAQLLATDQGNQLSLKAAQADSNKFYDSRHKIQSLQNEDMLYNRKAADTNMAAIADKEKSDANIKANLTLENATNLSNMWAGISKQIMDGYDRRKQQLLHYEMKRAANRQAVAASEYNARKAALDTTDKKKYAEDLANLGKEYMDALDRSNIQELERTRRLLGPDVLHIASLIRKGKKLTADLRYILSGSQDFNRRKLSDAKEFYKNIRETQRRRKS